MNPKNAKIAREWLHCFNTKNLEGLLSLYDDEAMHLSPKLRVRKPETKGLVQGKAALRAWWQDAFTRLPSLHYKELSLTSSDGRVFIEYLRLVDGEESLHVAEVLEISDQGKIVKSRVYHG